LQTLLANLWPAVERGDIKAIATAVRVLERVAKLNGLDQPARVQVDHAASSLEGMSEVELEERLRAYGVPLVPHNPYCTAPTSFTSN
jgi:hypothetical protein